MKRIFKHYDVAIHRIDNKNVIVVMVPCSECKMEGYIGEDPQGAKICHVCEGQGLVNSNISDETIFNAISKLLWTIEEPQGDDTRCSLKIEDCVALLAVMDGGCREEICRRVHRVAHGGTPSVRPERDV